VCNIRRNMEENDKVGLEFVNQSCPDKPFYVSSRFACLLDKDVILARTHKVLQSNQFFFLNDVLSIAVMEDTEILKTNLFPNILHYITRL
jgi:hypothetical protein